MVNTPYFIRVQDSAAYSVYLSVKYISQGKIVSFDTPYMDVFMYITIPIPEDAYNITVDIYIATFIGWWYRSGQIYSQEKPMDCYNLYGTIFNPYFQKVPCPTPERPSMATQVAMDDPTRVAPVYALFPNYESSLYYNCCFNENVENYCCIPKKCCR
ncbi:MAG: hypothetical protein RSB66_03480 [Clostridium sp.]